MSVLRLPLPTTNAWRPIAFGAVPALVASLREWTIPTLAQLFPSIVLAVPKKKTSHSRKAMREANKGLKDKQSASAAYLTRETRLICSLQILLAALGAEPQNWRTTYVPIAIRF
ncbi:putative 54S ribosomal protein L32, mitochondrial [Mycena kentingensis (nom. inval.)]|nr:putative 54S ribosomal protein L32, mitochondrial [Mycena kentingensis (nom. inval.)]